MRLSMEPTTGVMSPRAIRNAVLDHSLLQRDGRPLQGYIKHPTQYGPLHPQTFLEKVDVARLLNALPPDALQELCEAGGRPAFPPRRIVRKPVDECYCRVESSVESSGAVHARVSLR
jgi:hypothetical protein